VQDIGFAGVFGFKYSERPHTPAQKLEDDVDEAEKSARLERLFVLADGIRRQHLESLVGTEQEVLFEGRGRTGAYTGRTVRQEIVHVPLEFEARGEVVPVRIVRAFKNSLEGEVQAPWFESAQAASARTRRAGQYAERRALPIVE
jgi:tRNA-2-methylthio-N6-dimethylallyladenosine synthase